MLRLAVIGGGPSATCVVEAVARRIVPDAQVHVTVFEPGENLWRGHVFQPDGDEVLANVPMIEMSARAWDPGHGARWLREHDLGEFADETVVPSRWMVGHYLEDTAEQAISAMRKAGSPVHVEPRAVRFVSVDEGRLHANGDGWRAGPFDHAVLCVGGALSYDHYELSGNKGFRASPYPLSSSMTQVPDRARVGVVGSGLTAVDVVMALRARGHQGPITLLSRNGNLPAVRRRPAPHELCHLTAPRLEALARTNGELSLGDLLGLATAELAEAGADGSVVATDIACTAPPIQRLRDDLAAAREDRDPGWAVLRDAMVACGQDAWYLLRDEDKARIRTWHHTLMRHCCPMPPGNAAHLLGMFGTGQLEVLPGVRSVRPRSGGGFHAQAQRDLDVDVVVAASTPADHLPAPQARSLLASLVSQGLAVPHPFGGVRVDRVTSRMVTWRGVPDGRLHALGDVTHGAYLFTFGMPVLAARADRIVDDIRRGLPRDKLPVGH